MCYRPIHIYNPVRTFNNDQPVRIAVPCGKCADCQRIMKNEWFFRSYIEYKHYKKIGGSVYFVTLTYNNENLPWLSLPNGDKVPCFNRLHVRNFIKYIRTWLKRNHMMHTDIKFLVCSEYGKHTKRPHYHGILYFPFHIPELSFTRLMRTWWQHGFVICSKQGWEIKSLKGISYASKYVAKDFNYYNLPQLSKLRYELGEEEYNQFLKDNKDSLPKHWQSIFYGASFINVINSQPSPSDFLVHNQYSLWNDDKGVFPIPRYYHLKIEKSINKEYSKLLDKVVLERTEIGTEVKKKRLETSVFRSNLNLKQFLSGFPYMPTEEKFNECISFLRENLPHQLPRFEKIYALLTQKYSSYDDMCLKLATDIPQYINKLGLGRVSAYLLFLRYYPLYYDEVPEHMFSEIYEIKNHMVYTNVYPPEYADVIVPSGLFEFGSPLNEHLELRKQHLCSNHPYFAEYEYLAKLIDDFNSFDGLIREFNTLTKAYRKVDCKHYEGVAPHIYTSFKQ